MTPYQKHCKKWKACVRCNLCNSRNSIVLARGKVPSEILFIGEAPGRSEDVLGAPFVGPAGKQLDEMIEQAIDAQYDYAITNLIACIPLDDEGGKTAEPPKVSILACKPRLQEFVSLVKPKLIVLVGKLAAKHASLSDYRTIQIMHPAGILRLDISQKALAIKRNIVILSDAIDEF